MTKPQWDAAVAQLKTSLIGVPKSKKLGVCKQWLKGLSAKDQAQFHALYDVMNVFAEASQSEMTNKKWWIGVGCVAVAAIVALSGFYAGRRNGNPAECKPGYAMHEGECAPGADPVDKFARCIIQDVRVQQKAETSATASAMLRKGKDEGQTLAELRENFEKSAEKTTNECVLLVVVAQCAALAGGPGQSSDLPARCR